MTWLHAFKEAYQSIRTHKTRTLSMGFGVSLAIFILQLLLTVGNSLHTGITQIFAKYGEKTMWIYRGSKNGIPILIPTELVVPFSKQFKIIHHITPQWFHYASNKKATYANKTTTPWLTGVDPTYATLANIELQAGRFITARDITAAADICVLGADIKKDLFGATAAIGKLILLGNKSLQVVGVLEDASHLKMISDCIVLGSSLFKKLQLRARDYVTSIRLTLMPTAHAVAAEKQFRSYFARQLHFNPTDKKAIGIFSMEQHAAKFHRFFQNLSTANWIIGILFLITGIVSLSNMMLVTIHERTKEIAIRRVLGSSITAIIAMVTWEVLLVTMLAGALGSISSFALIQLLNKWVIPAYKDYYFTNLTCSFEIMLSCLGLLCLTSSLTTVAPVIRAIRIKPVTALNN
ncbi:ABC transporter permease [Candidatus Cardinium hertigii]|uniref:Macrolide export ATP-binding/permease protein MacB n=1 Tax=Candidatus Cardinium hertigii TaxID=247481 RepID=A0A2Z3LIJ1_9BACT|nr:ABC transporter permease [Candidatus Cardinium hertigii]AWN82264.1 Macrolide export ATP-binding/permease protein MacB [Candidatus Cardinium hertigii]